MKKLIAMLLALTMVLGFAACAAKEEAPVEDTPVVEDAPAVEEEPVVEEEPAVEDEPAVMPEEDPTMDEPAAMPEEPGAMPEVDAPEMPEVSVPAANGALDILNAIWGDFADDEKFPIYGGNMEAPVMDAPGVFDLTMEEALTTNLLIPADQLANVTEVATMIHLMNANTFTCGVVRLADGVAAADFAAAMESAIMGNRWMCGFPDSMLVVDIDGAYVLVAFGLNDAMNPLADHLSAVYPDAAVLYNQPIV